MTTQLLLFFSSVGRIFTMEDETAWRNYSAAPTGSGFPTKIKNSQDVMFFYSDWETFSLGFTML